MSFRKWSAAGACVFLLVCVVATTDARVGGELTSAEVMSAASKPPETDFITAQELKNKLGRNESVTVIDVRSTNIYIDSNAKIKGAIRVKERRLKARLAHPPLRDVPRDREVVIYCACQNDEASIRSAELLFAAGFKRVRVLKGGWQAWLDAGGQLESKQ